jgi:hypothetical protein
MAAAVAIAVFGCAGATQTSADHARSSGEANQPPAATPSASAASTDAALEGSARPVGSKLIRDVDASPRVFKIGSNDGQGLGDYDVTVDGREVWPPKGKGCPELVRCCTDLAATRKELALACLLATGRDADCGTARRTSMDIALEHGFQLPPSCPQ